VGIAHHNIYRFGVGWAWVRSQTVEFYILNSQGLPAIVRQAAQRATPRLINRYSAGNNYFWPHPVGIAHHNIYRCSQKQYQ